MLEICCLAYFTWHAIFKACTIRNIRQTDRQIGLFLPFDYYKQCCYEHGYINIYLRISLGKIISIRFLILTISLAWIYSTLEQGRLII